MKIGQKSPLFVAQWPQIVILHKEGYSEQLISEQIRCIKNAAHNAIMKFIETANYSDAETIPRNDHIIRLRTVRSSMNSTIKTLSILLTKSADLSRRIVSQHLFDSFHLKFYKPVKKTPV